MMPNARRWLGVAIIVAVVAADAPPCLAQTRSPVVEQALRLRDAGEFEDAVRLLEPYVDQTPADREAVRILAQSLYWLGRRDDARRVYEQALMRHADDAKLRLEFGRMLLETGDRRRVREIMEPLQRDPVMLPYADALLGTMAYWDGDYVTARRLLRNALDGDSTLAEPRRQLGEIAAVGAPWFSMSGNTRVDDQRLTRLDVGLSGGISLTPLLSLEMRGGAGRFQSGDSISLDIASAEAGFRNYAPVARLETEAFVGAVQRGPVGSAWTGRARAGLRFPRGVTLNVAMQREPYFYTVASVRTPFMTRTASGFLALASQGWLGEAAVQQTRYPDDNTLRTAYAWLLAPLVRSNGTRLQVGYGATVQDAAQSRFVLATPNQPLPPGQPPGGAEGEYDPYYTPADLVVHSVLGAMEWRAGRTTLRAGGSYGFRATDRAPEFSPPAVSDPGNPNALERTFVSRSFSPWTARASLDIAPSADVKLGISGESVRTVFYTATTARVWLTYQFVSAAMRRATRR
jgi:Flp pilus assembly protein TadD